MALKVCLGFVVVDETAGTVELFHFTLKEYLMTLPGIFADVTVDAPRTCLTFLSYDAFKLPCEDHNSCRDRRTRYRFAAYASSNWADHVRGPREQDLEICLLTFLASGNIFSALQMLPATATADSSLLGKDTDHYRPNSADGDSMAVYLSVCFRLKATLRILGRKCNPDIIVPWGERYSPLHVAISLEDEDMCNDLVHAGASLDVQDQWGLTPLHLAVSQQSGPRSRFVDLLCKAGASCTIFDQDDDTALKIAARGSDIESVRLLLRYGSNANARDKRGVTALHEALRRFSVEVIEALVANGAHPTITDDVGDSPLALAIGIGYYSIVQLLLSSIDCGGAPYRPSQQDAKATQEFLAPLKRNEQELLAKERENLESYHHRIQLESRRREEIVSKVMAGRRVRNLSWAVRKGDGYTLHDLLIDLDYVNTIRDTDYQTPHVAASNGRQRVVWHLLAAGADTSLRDRYGRTARDLARSPGILHLLEGENWLKCSRPVCTRKGTGMISGERLREVYKRDCGND
jgi:ankyrin repeat protein